MPKKSAPVDGLLVRRGDEPHQREAHPCQRRRHRAVGAAVTTTRLNLQKYKGRIKTYRKVTTAVAKRKKKAATKATGTYNILYLARTTTSRNTFVFFFL